MSLCRFYPPASDRMAIIWSLMPVKDAIVLEYGPAGTTHFGGGLYSSLGISLRQSLFTTHISEDDVIMGDVTRLEKAIVEIDETYAPKVIFVVASAVVAVIGTDIRGVCRYMQEKVNAKLVAFEDGGFRGDYTYGLRAVYKLLAKKIAKDLDIDNSSDSGDSSVKEEKTYQIIGASAGSYRIRSDVWELQQLMTEAFGWKCRMVMGLETDVKHLETAGAAALNLVIRQEALEAGNILNERFGTPFVYGAPYGYQGTLDWLHQISAVIGEPINEELLARIEDKQADMMPMGGGPMASMRRKPAQASIQADYDTLLGLASALQELDIEPVNLICSHSLKTVESPDERVTYYAKEKERLDLYQALHGQWVLGDSVMESCMPEDTYFTCVSFPFAGKPQIAHHFPFMGEKGMDFLRECKEFYFDKLEI